MTKASSSTITTEIRQTGLMTLKVPAYLLAALVAEKLGKPAPINNPQCEIVEDDEAKEDGSHTVNVFYEYLDEAEQVTFELKPADVGTQVAT